MALGVDDKRHSKRFVYQIADAPSPARAHYSGKHRDKPKSALYTRRFMEELTLYLNLIFRFVHVLAAIMWVGSSIFFNWLDSSVTAREGSDDEKLEGDLWMIHGGGIYLVEKRRLEPHEIPPVLHWFKWEAYTTWLSGFVLLLVTFYLGEGSQHILLLSLFGGWLVYDLIWRSPLGDDQMVASILSFGLLMAAVYGLCEYANAGRVAFIHVGAMMGTFMAGNVFFHIIPMQKKLMAALKEGKPHDLEKSKIAKTRSRHNNYMTFPVLFIMLSNHYTPITEHWLNWIILGLFMVMLAVIKHFMNISKNFKGWLAAVVVTFMVGSAAIYAVNKQPMPIDEALSKENPLAAKGKVLFNQLGCQACHQSAAAQLAPSLIGVMGRTETLVDGSTVVVDEAYLRESIMDPQAKIVKGYPALMPDMGDFIGEEALDQLMAYILSMEETEAPAPEPAPEPEPALELEPQAPASLSRSTTG